jgi:tRNA modification GTPase
MIDRKAAPPQGRPDDGRTVTGVLTPAGRGAIATVVVEGPRAEEIVLSRFVPGSRRWSDGPTMRIRLGRWSGSTGEEVVVCKTSERRFEIHCHGGAAAAKSITSGLAESGCATLDWPDWLARESSNSIVAEALADLALAGGERTALILLDQAQGALSRALRQIAGQVEAGEIEGASAAAAELRGRAALGRRLTRPWRVVLTGRVNVGKSSLINSLAGYERSIVNAAPGTTRDVVTVAAAIDGWPVELSDTAGLRNSDDAIEQAGVALAARRAAAADLVVLVFDASAPWTSDDDALVAAFPEAIVVHNKIDLLDERRDERSDNRPEYWPEYWPDDRPRGVQASAIEPGGTAGLLAALGRRLAPSPPPVGAAVPFRERHLAALAAVEAALARGDSEGALCEIQGATDAAP